MPPATSPNIKFGLCQVKFRPYHESALIPAERPYYPGKEDSHAGAYQPDAPAMEIAGDPRWRVGLVCRPGGGRGVRQRRAGGTVAGAADSSVTFFHAWVITNETETQRTCHQPHSGDQHFTEGTKGEKKPHKEVGRAGFPAPSRWLLLPSWRRARTRDPTGSRSAGCRPDRLGHGRVVELAGVRRRRRVMAVCR